VKKLVVGGEEFQVVDAKSGEDLTRSILLQIILEEETAGAPMFSSDILTQFIRSYGNAMQGMLVLIWSATCSCSAKYKRA